MLLTQRTSVGPRVVQTASDGLVDFVAQRLHDRFGGRNDVQPADRRQPEMQRERPEVIAGRRGILADQARSDISGEIAMCLGGWHPGPARKLGKGQGARHLAQRLQQRRSNDHGAHALPFAGGLLLRRGGFPLTSWKGCFYFHNQILQYVMGGGKLVHSASAPGRYRLGVDIGGTFTDLSLIDDETQSITTHKVQSTPKSPSRAVSRGIVEVMRRVGASPADIGSFVHGTTIALNAVLERRGSEVALLVSDGTRDILASARATSSTCVR